MKALHHPMSNDGMTTRQACALICLIAALAIISFWARSFWEARRYYNTNCVIEPSPQCVEDLRRAASWASPFNVAARSALRDLRRIADGPIADGPIAQNQTGPLLTAEARSPHSALAAQGAARATATTRSIFDPSSAQLPHDLNAAYAVIAFVCFIGWIASVGLMIQRGWNADGALRLAGIRRYGLQALTLWIAWMLALTCA